MLIHRQWSKAILLGCAGAVSAGAVLAAPEPLNFNFQIKPILAEHCFKCHGQDEKQRKADLRLDDRENSISTGAIVPGDPEKSTLIQRIITQDEEDIMPPPGEHRPLSVEQIALLKQWVQQGAHFEKHWSFIPPVAPQVPSVKDDQGVMHNTIDAFVLARLGKQGLTQAPPATREAWLRRVTFDLIGLPPTIEEMDAFLADESPTAYSTVVDRLLASPRYGEHMAVDWLDAARYADTYGRHEDHDCLTWPYRDWVIRSFNRNQPFDEFIRWQTAGDMLPAATEEMFLATVFNRLPQQSNEAGSNEDEFRQDIVDDRIRTNGIAFLGLSLECAKCHDHKYDPISQKDYYSFSAFLNNIDESGLYTVYTENVPAPSLLVYEGEDERQQAEVKLQIRLKEAARQAMLPEARLRFEQWLQYNKLPDTVVKPIVHLPFDSFTGEDLKDLPNMAEAERLGRTRLRAKLTAGRFDKAFAFRGDNSVTVSKTGQFSRTQPFSFSVWMNLQQDQKRAVAVHYSRAGLDAGSQGYELLIEDNQASFALCHFWPGNAIRIRLKHKIPLNAWTMVTATYDGSSRAGGMRLYVNGLPAETEVVRDNLYKEISYGEAFAGKDSVEGATFTMGGRHNDGSLTNVLADDLMLWDKELTPAEVGALGHVKGSASPEHWFGWWLREKDESWMRMTTALKTLREEENRLSMRAKEVMVMRERPEDKRRDTFILDRGHFEARTNKVGPDTPSAVFAFPEDMPRTRLGYAQWLTDRRNPLTARVYVNRMWQHFFGRGIVSTSEDFGVQGQLPTHPELLDWLAVWFMDNGWDVKKLCRLMALSATYGQDSLPVDKQLLTDDPDNSLLAHGPRQRLTAEQIRDNALFVSGLLVTELGGAPVKPYQPVGLWEDSGTQHAYHQDHGQNLFRRSCYTFWRRTLPPPTMSIFDAPTREFCKSRRDKSTTPMQALVLFNDPQLLEAARVYSEKLVRQHPDDDFARVTTAFRAFTGRQPLSAESDILLRLIKDQREQFASAPAEADALRRKNGEAAVAEDLSAVEVACTTLVVRALLAYDETVMKP